MKTLSSLVLSSLTKRAVLVQGQVFRYAIPFPLTATTLSIKSILGADLGPSYENGSLVCNLSGGFCGAGDGLSGTNILIQCANGTGYARNCDGS